MSCRSSVSFICPGYSAGSPSGQTAAITLAAVCAGSSAERTVLIPSSGAGGSRAESWLSSSFSGKKWSGGAQPPGEQLFPVGALERRAGHHGGVSLRALAVHPVADGAQPRRAVGVGERDARAHLGDVGCGVKGVGVREPPAEPPGDHRPDRRLPAARYPSHDEDHESHPTWRAPEIRAGPRVTTLGASCGPPAGLLYTETRSMGRAGSIRLLYFPWPLVSG